MSLTAYISDLVSYTDGQITATEIRRRWRAGRYPGVSDKHAKGYAKMHGIGR